MTDDRSLERAARSWLETGPTQAPDRAVEAALLRIQTSTQERDLRVPWRFPPMTTPVRVAVLIAVGALVLAGIGLLGGIGSSPPAVPPPATVATPTPPALASVGPSATPDALAALQQYRAARDAVCTTLMHETNPPAVDAKTDPAGAIAAIQTVIDRGNREVDQLAALLAPPAVEPDHLANVQTARDVLALLQHEIDLIQQNKADQIDIVDQSTAPLSASFEQFEARYSLAPCP